MQLDEHIKYWLESADHDLEAAESLFAAGKYDWCLFLSHLVLEKAIKDCYVKDNDNKFPPESHNLLKLIEKTSIPVDDERKIFLDEVDGFNLEVRYPEYKMTFQKVCTKEFTEKYFSKIKDYFKCLKSHIKSMDF